MRLRGRCGSAAVGGSSGQSAPAASHSTAETGGWEPLPGPSGRAHPCPMSQTRARVGSTLVHHATA